MTVIPRERQAGEFTKFSVKHYAAVVEYEVKGFIGKNKNEVADEIRHMAFELMGADLAPPKAESTPRGLTPAQHSKYRQALKGPKTTVTQFRDELESLLALLRTTQSHFVRCIKPNDDKVPGEAIQ